jgi:hypothetical protein
MNRDVTLKEQRKAYVQNRVAAVRNKETEIKRIARELFLSEKTIKRDLK